MFVLNVTATTEIYTYLHTLSLLDSRPICLLTGVIDVTTTEIADEIVGGVLSAGPTRLDSIIRTRLPYVGSCGALDMVNFWAMERSEEHTSELQSLMRISSAVFCLKKKKKIHGYTSRTQS